ncbi:MerR family transcriptional regulator [Nocardia sp. CA-135398]|uniref:DNA polymerase III subunit beta family protein n=1 Tax=Nocardia sp. CA-135398 TaxID=3239977 RepID=UPI003D97CD80
MAGDGLITIGGLARACGLTASALRFYDDCGLLVPVRVDELTGYRYYSDAQIERGVMIRRLRGIGVPLEVVSEILNADGARAERLLDEHVAELARRAREAAAVARVIKEEIGAGVVLSAAVLAAAIEQVRSAAALDREIPVLTGVLVESDGDSVTLTATDRYRLSTRAMAPVRPSGAAWSAVVDAGELGGIASWLRGLDEVTVRAAGGALVFTAGRAADDGLVSTSGQATENALVSTSRRATDSALVSTPRRAADDALVSTPGRATDNAPVPTPGRATDNAPVSTSRRTADNAPVSTPGHTADDALVSTSRRATDNALTSTPGHATDNALVSANDGSERRCGTIDEAFPDYRAMLAGLGAIRTRVVVGRDALLTVLEDGGASPVVFSVNGSGLFVTCDEQFGPGLVTCGGHLLLDSPRSPDSQPSSSLRIPAAVTGPNIDIAFSPTTLRPALVSAIGPEVMLDIAAADAPVVVRSATDGELTTLVMPTAVLNSKEYGA